MEPVEVAQSITVLRINNNTKIAIIVRHWLIRGVVGIGRPNNADLF